MQRNYPSLLRGSIGLFLLCLCFLPGHAQNAGQAKVNLNIRPSYSIVYIDSVKLNRIPDSLDLDTGTHFVQVWAPRKKLLERTVKITSSTKQAIGVSLSYSEEYKAYRKAKTYYMTQRFLSRYFLLQATGLTAAFAAERITTLGNEMDKQQKLAEAARLDYQSGRSILTITPYENAFEDHRAQYQQALKARNNWILGASIAIPVGLVSYILIQRTERLVKPVFKEVPLLTQTDFYYMPLPQGGNFGLCYHF